jgi:DNA-binding response OmpR family regulator
MAPFKRKKILVVEDDLQVAFGLQKRLLHAGFEVVTTGSGEGAIYCAECEQPSAITLDVRLPDIDGLEVAWRLRRNAATSNIPIIFITGKADRHFKEDCNDVGGLYFIRKPYDPDLLIRLLKSVLAQDELGELQELSAAKRRQPVA